LHDAAFMPQPLAFGMEAAFAAAGCSPDQACYACCRATR
jgi:hypothetical protein